MHIAAASQPSLCFLPALKRKRSEAVEKYHQPVRQPASVSSAEQLPSGGPRLSTASKQPAAPVNKSAAVVDEDDDLCVELAFTKKSKPAVSHQAADFALSAFAKQSDDDAEHGSAKDNQLLTRQEFLQQDWSLADPDASPEKDDEIYDVPDDEPQHGSKKQK